MKFEINDDTDKALVSTIVHEMSLCKACFSDFLLSAAECHKNPNKKTCKIKAHDSYSQFLSHLYEFYIGCISRDRRDTAQIKHDEIDKTLTLEAEKQLRSRRILLEKGILPGGNAVLAMFKDDVPMDFGRHFRQIRNRTAHVLTERSSPTKAPDLNSFFRLYHHFILLLFYSGQFAWDMKDAEKYNWGLIEEFNFGA